MTRKVGLLVGLAAMALWFGTLSTQAQDTIQLGQASDYGPYSQNASKLSKLLSGTPDAPGKSEWKEVMETTANWLVYRFTHLTVIDNLAKNNPTDMDKAIRDFKSMVEMAANPNWAAKNQEFMKQYGKELAKRFREIFDKFDMTDNNRLIVVNAGLMLPHLARTKDEAAADLLIDLLKDPKRHDVLKLYALKGLKEYFPARILLEEDDQDKAKVAQKARDSKRIEALRDFLDSKWSMGTDQASIQFIRREAIAALAQTQVPAIYFQKKQKKLEAPAVYALIRPLVPNGLTPPPSFAEKCEAAIGLCNLKAAPDYQADVAVYLVANFLSEFAGEYAQDWSNFAVKDKSKKLPLIPWKVQCERFLHGLENLKESTKDTPAYKNAVHLQAKTKYLLEKMKNYERIETEGLRPEIRKLLPQSTALFKSNPAPLPPKFELPQ